MRVIQFLFVAVLAFIWACQPASLTEPIDLNEVAEQSTLTRSHAITRPFKAKGYAEQITPTIVCDLTIPRAAAGTGTGTHIGRFEVDIQECLDFTTGIALGTASHMCANGDLLVTEYTMQYIMDPQDPSAIQGIFTNWTVDGDSSTGRFENATGSGTGILVGDLEENWMEWEVEGTITY